MNKLLIGGLTLVGAMYSFLGCGVAISKDVPANFRLPVKQLQPYFQDKFLSIDEQVQILQSTDKKAGNFQSFIKQEMQWVKDPDGNPYEDEVNDDYQNDRSQLGLVLSKHYGIEVKVESLKFDPEDPKAVLISNMRHGQFDAQQFLLDVRWWREGNMSDLPGHVLGPRYKQMEGLVGMLASDRRYEAARELRHIIGKYGFKNVQIDTSGLKQ